MTICAPEKTAVLLEPDWGRWAVEHEPTPQPDESPRCCVCSPARADLLLNPPYAPSLGSPGNALAGALYLLVCTCWLLM